ncbi:MAG: Nif3-like dinuclear metal center hexameric protein [Saprospiraceae bacterium]
MLHPATKAIMLIKDIITVLEQVAPPHLQETYDNAGLLVGNDQTKLTGVLFCLDSTEAVIEEALRRGCNLIVAHHPIVFRGLKRLNGSNYVERTVIRAIRSDLAIYAIHTNLDNVHRQGVNSKIAEKLGLQNTRILAPRTALEGVGAGLLGELPHPFAETDFLQLVKRQFQTGCVRHTALLGKPVQRIAVCGGSGSFLLAEAQRAGADAFVTADFKYHEFFDADGRILITDVGHYESEQFTIELLYDIIREKFPTFALHCTDLNTNPVFYV